MISHDKISVDHLYDEVHLGMFAVRKNELSGVQLLGRDLYHGVYGKEPSRESLIQAQRGAKNRQGRSRKNSQSPRGKYRLHGH